MQNNYDLEEKVLEKLEQKIAVEKYKTENKQVKKKNNNILLKVASLILAVGVISGNVYTFAKYDENMFSWALKKVGILSEYDKEKKDVGITVTNNGVSLTLTDYGVDKDTLIVGYKLKLEKKVEMAKYMYDNSRLECDGKIYNIDNAFRTQLFSKVSDTEYDVYNFYKIDGEKITDGSKFVTNVNLWKYDELESEDDIIGKWDFEIELKTEDVNLEYKVYEVDSNNIILNRENAKGYVIPEVELLEVTQSKISTKFLFLLKYYETEPGTRYYVEILDENDNVLLENQLEYLNGGIPTDIILGKIDLNSKLKINIYEFKGKITAQGSMEIDLKKALHEKNANEKDVVEKETKNWEDISFEYPKGAEIYETTYGYVFDDSESHYIDFPLVKYYGSQEVILDHISISNYENRFNQNLKDVATDIRKLMKIGGYRLENLYKVYISDEDGFITDEFTLIHEQMMELADKEYLEIDGKELTSENVYFENTLITDIKEHKYNNINTISWIEGNDHRRYIFIYKGNVYDINCPTTLEQEDVVEEFLNSIKLK